MPETTSQIGRLGGLRSSAESRYTRREACEAMSRRRVMLEGERQHSPALLVGQEHGADGFPAIAKKPCDQAATIPAIGPSSDDGSLQKNKGKRPNKPLERPVRQHRPCHCRAR